MNGRKAKELRRLAETITVGKPAREYGRVMIKKSPTSQIALRDCTRRVYKKLKKLSQSGEGIVGPKPSVGGIQEAV